jgi:hypothetical protein
MSNSFWSTPCGVIADNLLPPSPPPLLAPHRSSAIFMSTSTALHTSSSDKEEPRMTRSVRHVPTAACVIGGHHRLDQCLRKDFDTRGSNDKRN